MSKIKTLSLWLHKTIEMANEILGHLMDISKRRIANTETEFLRELYKNVEWKSRLILLKGCRGVGKTYMMLQRLKSLGGTSVYLSLDNIYFLSNTLTETIDALYIKGYRYFGLDEVHKYPNWSIEIKNIYDNYTDVHLIITSSSALNILAGQGDLSRRLDEYRMRGMSFKEFLVFEYKEDIPDYTMSELLENYTEIYDLYFDKLDLGRKFNAYLKKGYYPFYKESGSKYHDRLQSVVLQVIDSDMAAIFKIDYESARQIKKMLAMISKIVPFSPNVSKLSRDLALSRNSVLTYLDYLSEADIIFGLKSNKKSDSSMTKPDKIYLENTNLLYAFDGISVNSGTSRETFTMNTLSRAGVVSTPIKGDFMIDEKYVIEVGGANKSFHQLSGMPNAILVKDGISNGSKGILPMWMLGLLKTKW